MRVIKKAIASLNSLAVNALLECKKGYLEGFNESFTKSKAWGIQHSQRNLSFPKA